MTKASGTMPEAFAAVIWTGVPEFVLAGPGKHFSGELVVKLAAEVALKVTAVTLGEFLRDGVRYGNAFGDSHAVADLTQHAGKRDIQRRTDRGQEFRGSFLLAAFHFTQVTQGDPGAVRNFAEGTALTLADIAQYITDFVTKYNHLALLLFALGLIGEAHVLPADNAVYGHGLLYHLYRLAPSWFRFTVT
jgi:hypothetical protein